MRCCTLLGAQDPPVSSPFLTLMNCHMGYLLSQSIRELGEWGAKQPGRPGSIVGITPGSKGAKKKVYTVAEKSAAGHTYKDAPRVAFFLDTQLASCAVCV